MEKDTLRKISLEIYARILNAPMHDHKKKLNLDRLQKIIEEILIKYGVHKS